MKRPKHSFVYSVIFKIGIFAIILASLYAWTSAASVRSFQQQNDLLYNNRRDKDIAIFDAMVVKNSEPVASFAQDYGLWDDMVNYIDNPVKNAAFAEINLTPAPLATYKTDALRIYNAKGELVIGVDANTDQTGDFTIPGDIKGLFNKSRTIHFFAKHGADAMEVYGATVHPSTDDKRQTPIRGYIFTIKYLNRTYMDEIGNLLQNHLEVIDLAKTDQYPTVFDVKTGHLAFKYDLKDINGNTVAQFYITDEITAIKGTSSMQSRLLYSMFAIYSVTGVAFVLVIYWLVFKPLNRIIRGLNNEDDKSLRDLNKTAKSRSEYGRLASLVIEHKTQEQQLQGEKAEVDHQVELQTRELQEEHARLQASIESLNVGYFVTGPDDNILMINQKAKDLLHKVPVDEEKYQNIWTIERVEESLKGSVPLADRLKECRKSRQVINLQEVNFDHSVLKIYIAPIVKNSPHETTTIGVVVLLEDVTEVKVLERSRDEFFSIASHELRTPLTAIMGNTKMIMDYYAEQLTDKNLNEMVSDIHESSVRLIDIVNDFLDVSRIEQGRIMLKPEFFDITKILEAISYEMKNMLDGHNLYLKLETMTHGELPSVYADPARVKQILYNLIGNAAKFTEKGGITVSTTIVGDFLKVFVSDTGGGIPEDSKDLLFHKFQQIGEGVLTRDVAHGTGLGLYISKILIEKMGGDIRLESSALNMGSTFSFTLPIKKPDRGINYSPALAEQVTVPGNN